MAIVKNLLILGILSGTLIAQSNPSGSASATTAHGHTNFAVTIFDIGWRRGQSVEITVEFPDGSIVTLFGTVAGGSGGSTGVNVQTTLPGNESNYDGQTVTITATNLSQSTTSVSVNATVQ